METTNKNQTKTSPTKENERETSLSKQNFQEKKNQKVKNRGHQVQNQEMGS